MLSNINSWKERVKKAEEKRIGDIYFEEPKYQIPRVEIKQTRK